MRTFLSIALLFSASLATRAADVPAAKAFSKSVIDVGIVVEDLEKSMAFYTEAIGFTPAGKFVAKAAVANDAGLSTTSSGITIHKLKLGDDEGATTLKLMEIPDADRKKAPTATIHSQLGISYLTIRVTDMTQSLAKAAKLGYKPAAKGPVDLGGGNLYLAVLKDPDGNFIELVGPKATK